MGKPAPRIRGKILLNQKDHCRQEQHNVIDEMKTKMLKVALIWLYLLSLFISRTICDHYTLPNHTCCQKKTKIIPTVFGRCINCG
jgi:hypothetical protein